MHKVYSDKVYPDKIYWLKRVYQFLLRLIKVEKKITSSLYVIILCHIQLQAVFDLNSYSSELLLWIPIPWSRYPLWALLIWGLHAVMHNLFILVISSLHGYDYQAGYQIKLICRLTKDPTQALISIQVFPALNKQGYSEYLDLSFSPTWTNQYFPPWTNQYFPHPGLTSFFTTLD